jgi:hypothetical protein
MRNKLKKLKELVSPPTAKDLDDFWNMKFDKGTFEKKGLLLALQWCLHEEDKMRKKAADRFQDQGNFQTTFAQMSVTKEEDERRVPLEDVDWNLDNLVGLLRHDPNIVQGPKRVDDPSQFWMDSSVAINVVDAEVYNITDPIQELSM